MENKQTAIEWLDSKLHSYLPSIFAPELKEIFEQAKAIEKEQHGTTWDDALKQVEKRTVWARAMCDFDEYYEETYKK
jgi:hypothetical protein